MATTSDQLLMKIKTLKDIGEGIAQGASDLSSSLKAHWEKQFDTLYNGQEGTKESLGNNLPACLQQDFENYENKQKPELDDILQKRQQIGDTLSKASSLMDFQDKLTQKEFADFYGANNYYNSGNETVPSHLQTPTGFELHPDS